MIERARCEALKEIIEMDQIVFAYYITRVVRDYESRKGKQFTNHKCISPDNMKYR